MRVLKEMGAVVLISGLVALVAAWIAWATGDEVILDDGSSWHTHVDATWVLVVLGLLLLGNGSYMMSLGTPGSWVSRRAAS